MAYTKAQWEEIQKTLPRDERISFEEYLNSIRKTAREIKDDDAAQVAAAKKAEAAKKAIGGAATDSQNAARIEAARVAAIVAAKQAEIDAAPKAGKTQAQLDAEAGQIAAKAAADKAAAERKTREQLVAEANLLTKKQKDDAAAQKAASDEGQRLAAEGEAQAAKMKADADAEVERLKKLGLYDEGAAAAAKKKREEAEAAAKAAAQAATDATNKANAEAEAKAAAELKAKQDAAGFKGFYTATDGTIFTDQAAFVAYQRITSDAAANKKATDAAAAADRQSAYDLLYAQFSSYGLGSLVEPLRGLIQSGASPAEFTIKLRASDAYQRRFSANAQRINKGLKAINEAEYLGLEDQYQSIMRNAGLPESYYKRGELGIQEGFTNFIANDVSPVELEDRIMTAQKRLIYANPEVGIALKTFYPDITNGDLLAYALDPTKGLEQIKRRITAAEVGSSAVQLGLTTNVTDAEYLARYGVTKATAQQGYSTIAGGLQRGSQLASIYGQDPYTQTTAEQEVFNVPGAQEAKKQRQKITGLEKATFGGQTGITSSALARDRAGGY